MTRHRCGRDLTIERTETGSVRLMRWRAPDDGKLGIGETIHEWTAAEWCCMVLQVSEPERLGSEANRSLVLTEIERIHG